VLLEVRLVVAAERVTPRTSVQLLVLRQRRTPVVVVVLVQL
jgi:hypothetical protein